MRRTGRIHAPSLTTAVVTLLSCLAATSAAAQQAFDLTSITEADEFVNSAFSSFDSTYFESAAEAYLALLTSDAVSDDDRKVLQRHVNLALQVMPQADRPEAAAGSVESDRRAREQIALWWRRQDPFPATRRNERLEEHLARWAFAMKTFGDRHDERGFDDRGEIYVRLGSPGKQISVQLNPNVRAFDFTSSISVPDLPDNETWVYRHVHDEAYYFFVQDSKRVGYRLSRPSEMIPRRLRDGLDSRTDRGRVKTHVLLLVMEEVYAPLALAHPIFGSTFDAVAGFRGLPLSSQHRPELFARSTLATASSIETESAGRRQDEVPASYSNTRGMTEELPMNARLARFLEPDGTTRTEIYWSLDTSQLEPSRRLVKTLTENGFKESDAYLLATSVARQTPEYQNRAVETKHYLLQPTSEKSLRVQSYVVRGDTGLYNVAVQWTQHWSERMEDGTLGEGALLKMSIARFDTLQALHGGGELLEMSDLKPVDPDRDTPFPYRHLNPLAPPDLVFELYNLHFGSDDRTHYSIEYEVLRGDDKRASSTSARTSNSGSERNARERIALDLSDVTESGPIRITLRVTDDVTKEQIARSIGFVIDP